jgi:hypothetical protein
MATILSILFRGAQIHSDCTFTVLALLSWFQFLRALVTRHDGHDPIVTCLDESTERPFPVALSEGTKIRAASAPIPGAHGPDRTSNWLLAGSAKELARPERRANSVPMLSFS